MCAVTAAARSAFDTMSREEFVAWHVQRCQAGRARKYDVKKSAAACHSFGYSRRKCAKKIWKQLARRRGRA